MSRIQISKLTFTHSDGIQALQEIDLELNSGSRTAVVGPNGAGKTSLLMAIAGLIKVNGEIQIEDTLLSSSTVEELRKNMSFVFQNPDEMLFMPTVMEDVCFGLDSLGLNEAQAKTRAHEALEQVSLIGFEHRSAHHLSYGERRKVCLAICLARRSPLTLFDEPSRELDPQGRRNFINMFREWGGTLILATHDLELVLETCEQMILIDDGQIIKT
ncbi:MAG: ABC transporter ATP-binding protein, partial [Candidatus Marinimicrobia bacterium]|nr:ABC transporter ATP-binding protein [Candidatus Neomarinimicrobiota bacterium]